MKILVTGGAGFIGLNFIEYLVKNSPANEIICFDKLTYAANKSEIALLEKEGEISFYMGDISVKQDVENAFSKYKPDVVVNFAAETHVDRSFLSPDIFYKTNITGVAILLEASLKHNIARFHQISTDEVYGPSINEKSFDENSKLSPTSPYSASKSAADLLVLSYFKTYGLNATVERSSNNYGRFQYPEKLIPLAISRAIKDEKIPIYGKGNNRRCWLYVDDHCDATAKILKYGRAGEIYNISGKDNISNFDLVNMILKIMDKKDDLIKFIKDRPSHDISYKVSSEKIKEEFNWQPHTSLDTGLRETINWYNKNSSYLINLTESKEYKEYFNSIYRF